MMMLLVNIYKAPQQLVQLVKMHSLLSLVLMVIGTFGMLMLKTKMEAKVKLYVEHMHRQVFML